MTKTIVASVAIPAVLASRPDMAAFRAGLNYHF